MVSASLYGPSMQIRKRSSKSVRNQPEREDRGKGFNWTELNKRTIYRGVAREMGIYKGWWGIWGLATWSLYYPQAWKNEGGNSIIRGQWELESWERGHPAGPQMLSGPWGLGRGHCEGRVVMEKILISNLASLFAHLTHFLLVIAVGQTTLEARK